MSNYVALVLHCDDHAEEVLGTRIDQTRMIVDSHPIYAPYAPCDIVRIKHGYISSVELWGPTFTVVAHLHDGDSIQADEALEEWASLSFATRISDDQIMVTSYSQNWLRDNVNEHPAVNWTDSVRTPFHDP